MPTPRFLQIHTLTSYPAVLLNRDDAGLAKRLPYGGAVRTRISSQCLKRHWRCADDMYSLRAVPGVDTNDFAARSRRHFSDQIGRRLVGSGFSEPEVVEIVGSLMRRVLQGGAAEEGDGRQNVDDSGADGARQGGKGSKNRGKAAKPVGISSLETKQAFLLTSQEVDFLVDQAERVLKGDAQLRAAIEEKPKQGRPTEYQRQFRENIERLGSNARVGRSIDAALFGRMVTSDVLANTDAAIHVAHAFTVHQQDSETDYFTVVDDLKAQDDAQDAGSAGIFDTELTSGLFYGYVVVDVPLLVGNLTGVAPEKWADPGIDRELPAKVVEHLLHLIATVSPGAKRGSTAPYAHAQMLLVEAGSRQPRTLASAFEAAVSATAQRPLSVTAEDALFGRLGAFDRAYGAREARRFLSLLPGTRDGASGPESLDALGVWAAECIRSAEA